MRVHFDNVNFGSNSGPNSFGQRLAKALFETGHEIVLSGPQADVSLVFIEPTGQPLAKRTVQRLDGIWFKPEDIDGLKNVRIKDMYARADAVVFQSEFNRQFIKHHWNAVTRDVVIHNGIELVPVKNLTIPALIDMRAQYEKIYACSANWHPQKRLGTNIELFRALRQSQPSSCLIIMGSNPDVQVADPHIFYSGSQPHEVCAEIYAAANWMLHLAWADHCPNVIVEALAQGTPVVCSEVGGTKELVGGYGVVLPEAPYGYEAYDYDHPPKIEVSHVKELADRTTLPYSSIADIDIRNVAKRYIELFQSLT